MAGIRSEVKRAAAAVGATVEWSITAHRITAEVIAPDGMAWIDGPHVLVGTIFRPPGELAAGWTREMVSDLIKRIGLGLTACTDPDCSACEAVR